MMLYSIHSFIRRDSFIQFIFHLGGWFVGGPKTPKIDLQRLIRARDKRKRHPIPASREISPAIFSRGALEPAGRRKVFLARETTAVCKNANTMQTFQTHKRSFLPAGHTTSSLNKLKMHVFKYRYPINS